LRQRIVLRGGVALITGAASGIGRALTLDLAGRGGALALLDRDAQGLAETGARAEALGATVDLHGLDLADAAAIRALPAAIRARHGRLDLLVNNAGVALGGAFADTDLDDFEWVLDVNLRAPVRLIHALLPLLRESRPAWIVNVSSLYGIVAPPGQTAYCASKFGLRGFSESLRHELSGSGTGLTLVHPGGVATAIARNARLPRGADPVQAERGRAAHERFLKLAPETAAAEILRAVERGAPRALVGSDARLVSLLQRLMPVGYWSLLGRLARQG